MVSLKYHCESCDSKFALKYNDKVCEDSPHICPFCGEYMLLDKDEEKLLLEREYDE